jgi:glutamine amidotransferase
MGWNMLRFPQNEKLEMRNEKFFAGLGDNPYFYFVHSYYVPLCEDTAAIADYIQPYSTALQKDNFYACQFHPEKSGRVGEQIIKNFLAL